MEKKVAFITGITGQDGSYLAEFLLNKGYAVHGIARRSSVMTFQRVDHLNENPDFHMYYGDLTDSSNLHSLLLKVSPDEVYNLGAQSHVAVSFEVPEYTAEVDAVGTIRLLNAIKDVGLKCKFYQASTSELFGGIPGSEPQGELTPFYPRSPYAAAKLYSYWVTINYRESYGLYACNGILFNHESPRRGETFVTKKITKGVAAIKKGKKEKISLGNLNAKRDWGHAKDYVEAMWMMLQLPEPKDFVIATGETHTIREFVELSFQYIDIEIEWRGKGIDEVGIDAKTKQVLIDINPRYYRPAEVEVLQGDITKAKEQLNWNPKTTLKELVHEMVQYDLDYDDYGFDI